MDLRVTLYNQPQVCPQENEEKPSSRHNCIEHQQALWWNIQCGTPSSANEDPHLQHHGTLATSV